MKFNIEDIRTDDQLARNIYSAILRKLFVNGPVSAEDMEMLSFISVLRPDVFEEQKEQVLYTLGLFYKENLIPQSLYSQVMQIYRECIEEKYHQSYTPIQADIVYGYNTKQIVSFSAPTSSGKSYLFMDLIKKATQDVVIVVPSRALINEYIFKLNNQIPEKWVNILPFIDKINLAHCLKSIYVLTPERCRELFKRNSGYSIEMFLFDEAQLTDEEDTRGMLFDSIVRKCNHYYPRAKILFAHPFVENPEAQIQKNALNEEDSFVRPYKERTVGQLFVQREEQDFAYFSINKQFIRQIIPCEDPIAKALNEHGHVLIYTHKTWIYDSRIFDKYKPYIDSCPEYDDETIQKYIEQLQGFIGGDPVMGNDYFSKMLQLMKRGVVVHHGSLPLEARLIVERFVQEGHSHICFATPTLEKGVNMLFDVVCLETIPGDALRLKNIIGRAGRSTKQNVFNVGTIVVDKGRKNDMRATLRKPAMLDRISILESTEPLPDPEAERFREAMKNDTFSEDYNMPESEVAMLNTPQIHENIRKIIEVLFTNGTIDPGAITNETIGIIGNYLITIFCGYWQREPEGGEAGVLRTANQIFFWRLKSRTFKNICHIRYAFITNKKEQRRLRELGLRMDGLKVNLSQCYMKIPGKLGRRHFVSLYNRDTLVSQVDYDKVVYDTYDYIDKTLGFYMSDKLYAAFMKYYEATTDERARKMAMMYKYGTYDERTIMLLRYGLSFDDIEELGEYVESVDEMCVTVKPEFAQLSEEKRRPLMRYVE